MNIKGRYKFTIYLNDGTTRFLAGTNLITFLGGSFFLNRAVNDEHGTMKYICLGNGTNPASVTDNSLGNETIRKECIKTVDADNKKIILTCNFTPAQLLGTTEIGVANDDILISHDVYEKITNSTLEGNIGEIEVEYTFELSTSSIRSNWTRKSDEEYNPYNVYYIDEPNPIISVLEEDNNYGYRKVNQLNSLKSLTGAYYYDSTLKKLYIRTSGNSDPNDNSIIVQNK